MLSAVGSVATEGTSGGQPWAALLLKVVGDASISHHECYHQPPSILRAATGVATSSPVTSRAHGGAARVSCHLSRMTGVPCCKEASEDTRNNALPFFRDRGGFFSSRVDTCRALDAGDRCFRSPGRHLALPYKKCTSAQVGMASGHTLLQCPSWHVISNPNTHLNLSRVAQEGPSFCCSGHDGHDKTDIEPQQMRPKSDRLRAPT